MAGLNADHINPFLIAATKIFKDMCMVDVKIGKPSIKRADFTNDTIIIMIGVTGEIKGQVLISFSDDTACDIASRMMMIKITFMDEISMSAISELGNMILGNAATIFSTKGIGIDITPPSICKGNVSFSNTFSQNISVPLLYEDKMFEINIAIM
jgi:chemotaxis protein CheX